MKLKLSLALLCLTLPFSLVHANSYTPRSQRIITPTNDQYVSVFGGINIMSDTRIQNVPSNKQQWTHGYNTHVSYGHNMESFVAELEAGFFTNSLDKHTNSGLKAEGATGTMKHLSFLANVLQNITVTNQMKYFWGLGAGPTFVGMSIKNTTINRVKGSVALTLGYQAITGFVFEARHDLEVVLQYRAFSHLNTKHKAYPGTSSETSKRSVKAPIIQSFELGARYLF